MADAGELEERTVEVNDPKLTADANRRLTEAVREVIGADRVQVPIDRPRVSHGEPSSGGPLSRMTSWKAATAGSLAVCAGVGMVIALDENRWWILPIALIVLFSALAVVISSIMSLASTTEYPDPFLAALLTEQGVRDPEVRFTELVNEFMPVADSEDRHTSVEDDPARATAEQQEAVTPAGGPSSAVGPGES